ncbi:hypothetical protein LINGRAHAP2_LOCUS11265 [Linum grandiflorum]
MHPRRWLRPLRHQIGQRPGVSGFQGCRTPPFEDRRFWVGDQDSGSRPEKEKLQGNIEIPAPGGCCFGESVAGYGYLGFGLYRG